MTLHFVGACCIRCVTDPEYAREIAMDKAIDGYIATRSLASNPFTGKVAEAAAIAKEDDCYKALVALSLSLSSGESMLLSEAILENPLAQTARFKRLALRISSIARRLAALEASIGNEDNLRSALG